MDNNQWKVILNTLLCKGNKDKRSSQTVKTMEINNISNSPPILDFLFQESRSSSDSDNFNENTENDIANGSLLNNRVATIDRVQKSNNRLSSLTLNTDGEGSFIRNNFGREVISSECSSNDVNKHKHPIMGKIALLKRNSVESTDSAIIQSIILNKYENILNYYVDRMYTRRISRVSNVEGEDETIDNTNNEDWSSIKALDDYSYENDDKFDFLESANNSDTETTKATFNNSICSEIDVISNCSEYDPRQFLVNVFGEATSSNLNSCECNLNIETCEESVGTSAISSLLSTTSNGSSLKQMLKRNKSKPTICTESNDMDFNENKKSFASVKPNSTMDQYKMELSRQHSIIFQTSKALSYCKSSKDFIVGKERIEAERILLIATITKEALVNEINLLEFDSYAPAFDSRCEGEIMLSNLTFSINKESIPKKSQGYKDIFVVVLKSGKTVFDSGVIEDIDKIISLKTFKFSNLPQDFEIIISVYYLLIMNEDNIGQDGKYSKCNVRSSFINTETSAFKLIGKCQIKNSELTKISANGNLRLDWCCKSPHNPLQSFTSVDVQYTFQLTNKLTGFLTLGIENGFITWNRRWCVLDGSVLKYWNYPSEESSVPIEIINLEYCMEQKISVANRSVCARPKTLYLPLRDSQIMKKYFISPDTQSDLRVWESELNFVVKSLLIWNGMKKYS